MAERTTGPVVQGLWVGEALSAMERLSIESFIARGHPYHLYVYQEVRNVPPGTVPRDAGRLVPAGHVFRDADRPTYAAFSDLFRYRLLVGSAVLKAPAGAELFARCHDVARGRDRARVFFDDIGPLLLTEKIRELDLMPYCLPPRTFYPLGWHEWMSVISDDPGEHRRTRHAIADGVHAVHLWNEMWRQAGTDKDATYHPGCLYERLKARHGVAA